MKLILILTASLLISIGSFAQKQNENPLPPLKELPSKPGHPKTFYQLPEKMPYKVYNKKGKLHKEGEGRFIDITKFRKGSYFIVYADQKVLYKVD